MKDFRDTFNTKQEKMEAHIANYVKHPPRAIYDIGVGPKTEWRTLSSIWPNAEMHGCEPQPSLYQKLEVVFPGRLHHCAISSERAATLYQHPEDVGSATMVPPLFKGAPLEVPAMTLDDFDLLAGQPRGILLWMDIEGYEIEALKTGIHLLESGRLDWVNLEVIRGKAPRENGAPNEHDVDRFLRDRSFVKVTDYNRHPKHMDVIYRRRGVQAAKG